MPKKSQFNEYSDLFVILLSSVEVFCILHILMSIHMYKKQSHRGLRRGIEVDIHITNICNKCYKL
jgi:hypothetical protein